MSHSGSNPSRRVMRPHIQTKEGEPMYAPSVYRYKCIGYLELNSDHRGSPGTCHGIKSRLERVANMVPDTREAAIKKFLDAAADYGTYVDSDDSTSDQKVKEIYTSRTLIYKQPINDPEDIGNYGNDAEGIVINDDKTSDTGNTATCTDQAQISNNRDNIHKAPMKSSSLLDEDLIDRTEWSCYGSTHVHFLVLDPMDSLSRLPRTAKQKRTMMNMPAAGSSSSNRRMPFTLPPQSGKIAAITPENFGLSVRKIDSQVGHFTVADIGSIRICLETQSSLMDYDSDNRNTSSNGRNPNQKSNATPLPQGAMAPSGIQRQQRQPQQQSQDQQDIKDEAKKKPSPLDLNRFMDFTGRVWIQMNQNVHALMDAVSDDFPGRTVAFGTKVVNRVPKTTEQTVAYVEKIFSFWKKDW